MASDALTLGGTVPEGVEATAKNGDVTVTEPYGPTPNGRRRKRW